MGELGAGGGQGDLDQHHELEVADPNTVTQLIALCASKLQGQPEALSSVLKMLTKIIDDHVQSIPLDGSVFLEDNARAAEAEDDFVNVDEVPIDSLIPSLAKVVEQSQQKVAGRTAPPSSSVSHARNAVRSDGLPRQIVGRLSFAMRTCADDHTRPSLIRAIQATLSYACSSQHPSRSIYIRALSTTGNGPLPTQWISCLGIFTTARKHSVTIRVC